MYAICVVRVTKRIRWIMYLHKIVHNMNSLTQIVDRIYIYIYIYILLVFTLIIQIF